MEANLISYINVLIYFLTMHVSKMTTHINIVTKHHGISFNGVFGLDVSTVCIMCKVILSGDSC